MKPRTFFIPVLLALVLGLILTGSSAAGSQETESLQEVLLLLPVPQPEALPNGPMAVETITDRLSRPVLKQLARLSAEGLIQDFALLPEQHAIHVAAVSANAVETLSQLDGIISIETMDTSGLACASQGARALQVLETASNSASGALSNPLRALSTNPSINVYLSAWRDYGSISGTTDPGVTVVMTLRNSAGVVKTTQTTTSSSSGYYNFRPEYQSCFGYDWYPVSGDTVEVTASGRTVSMLIPLISAFADPDTDTITGSTAANRVVRVYVDATDADCLYSSESTSTTSSGDGSFSTQIAQGFDRSTKAEVWVYDANENSAYTYTYPPRIELDYDGDIEGFLKPNISFTATLSRGDTTIESFSGSTDVAGEYYGWFSSGLQAGDMVEVSGGGVVVDMTYLGIPSLDFDLQNNLITGNAGSLAAGFTARVSISSADEYSCDYDYGCTISTIDGAGTFSLNYTAEGYDLRRGDTDYSPDIYDLEGNYQSFRGRLTVPIIEVYPNDDFVSGYWFEPEVPITITLQDSGGSVKDVDTDTTDDYDSDFYGSFYGFEMLPGDQVQVTDGTRTLTFAPIPDLTGQLNAQTNMVTGTATDGGTLIADLRHRYLDPLTGDESDWYCYTGVITAGSYSIDLSTLVDPTARGEVDIYYTGSDDHLAAIYSHAFSVNAGKESGDIEGYTPLSDTDVVIELWRAGAMQTTITTTSSTWDGFYSDDLSPQVITEGDIIRVKPQGIAPYDLNIPELTVSEDPPNNRVTGRSPASAVLLVDLDQPAAYGDWAVITVADSSGDYAASFDGVYDYCDPAIVGACTQPTTTYYNDEGHSVYIVGPEPSPVSADLYEADDTYQTATAYTGPQSHTFHTAYDEDWISFTVEIDDVGTPYYLATQNLGSNARTDLILYDTDGITELASETSYSPPRSEIIWIPDTAGVYYVKVEPYVSSYTVDCGSTYDFVIHRTRIYLPAVLRMD